MCCSCKRPASTPPCTAGDTSPTDGPVCGRGGGVVMTYLGGGVRAWHNKGGGLQSGTEHHDPTVITHDLAHHTAHTAPHYCQGTLTGKCVHTYIQGQHCRVQHLTSHQLGHTCDWVTPFCRGVGPHPGPLVQSLQTAAHATPCPLVGDMLTPVESCTCTQPGRAAGTRASLLRTRVTNSS